MKHAVLFPRVLCTAGLFLVADARAWEPDRRALDAAVESGDFAEYYANASAWLRQKVETLAAQSQPATNEAAPSSLSVHALKSLVDEPCFRLALDQFRLISRVGKDQLGSFTKARPSAASFMKAFMCDAKRMDLYLEGGLPAEGDYVGSLNVLNTILNADADARDGLYLRLAMATSLAHAKLQKSFDGEPIDPLKRYEHFKAAHQSEELDPMFDNLSVWELEKVVGSWASDADLAWGREMLRTMRPELVIEKRYVRQVSEVQYTRPDWGNPPHRFSNVLGGGGKCGPRAWFGRMINQSFGVPAWGVKQPGHAAVGFLGNTGWKVQYGRGWDVSHWGGMNGKQFLVLADAREYRLDFSQAEHLRWLSDIPMKDGLAATIRNTAEQIQQHPSGPRAANRLTGKRAFEAAPEEAYTPVPGVQRLWAVDFASSSNAGRGPSYVGGQQVNFSKNKDAWVEYSVDIPRAGRYGIKTRHAVCNGRCRFRIFVGEKNIGWMHLRDTKGLWGETGDQWEFDLPATKSIRFVFPAQRGVAVKWFALIEKSGTYAAEPE